MARARSRRKSIAAPLRCPSSELTFGQVKAGGLEFPSPDLASPLLPQPSRPVSAGQPARHYDRAPAQGRSSRGCCMYGLPTWAEGRAGGPAWARGPAALAAWAWSRAPGLPGWPRGGPPHRATRRRPTAPLRPFSHIPTATGVQHPRPAGSIGESHGLGRATISGDLQPGER
jgi:hypothetical protein